MSSAGLRGIYFIPFKTGISLQFSFSGQSIPNREDVKQAKGVKIYFVRNLLLQMNHLSMPLTLICC